MAHEPFHERWREDGFVPRLSLPIVTVLRDADSSDKAEVYRHLGLRLTYYPQTQDARRS